MVHKNNIITVTPSTSILVLRQLIQGRDKHCGICLEDMPEYEGKGCSRCTFRYCDVCREEGKKKALETGLFSCPICKRPIMKGAVFMKLNGMFPVVFVNKILGVC